MSIKIVKFDWGSAETLWLSQIATINAFLNDKTLNHLIIVGEYILGEYNDTPPVKATKLKGYQLLKQVQGTTLADVEAEIEAFLVGKTVLNIIQPGDEDDGFLLILYED